MAQREKEFKNMDEHFERQIDLIKQYVNMVRREMGEMYIRRSNVSAELINTTAEDLQRKFHHCCNELKFPIEKLGLPIVKDGSSLKLLGEEI